MKQPYNTTIYNTALYMRLSRDDESYGDSVSIETQRTILQQYAREQGLHVVGEYVDDGWSGTNFERPSFQRMMDDVEAGKVNCIPNERRSWHMMKENWVYRRGDIYCADLDPVVGSEQGGIRPVIVIQNDTGNRYSPTLIVATVTTKIRKKENMPTHLLIRNNPAFKEASVVQLEQIRTIDKRRIDNYLGKVTPREMVAIEKALSVSLAMEQLKKRSTKHKPKKEKE